MQVQQYVSVPSEVLDYVYSNEPERDQYFQENYNFYRAKDSLVTAIKDDSAPSPRLGRDTIPPTTNRLSQVHLGRPIMMMNQDFDFWFAPEGGYGTIAHNLLFREGSFWYLENERWEQSQYNDKYGLATCDQLCRHTQKWQQPLSIEHQPQKQIVYQIQQLDFSIKREINLVEVGCFVMLNNGSVKARFIDRTVITFQYPPPCEVKITETYGKSNRFNFQPEINEKYCQDQAYLLRYVPEEYRNYMAHCLELAEETFVESEIQEMRQRYQSRLSQAIENQLETNQRFLYLSGKIQLSELQHTNQENQISSEDLQQQVSKQLDHTLEMIKILSSFS